MHSQANAGTALAFTDTGGRTVPKHRTKATQLPEPGAGTAPAPYNRKLLRLLHYPGLQGADTEERLGVGHRRVVHLGEIRLERGTRTAVEIDHMPRRIK